MTELGIAVAGGIVGLLLGWFVGRRGAPARVQNPYAVEPDVAPSSQRAAENRSGGSTGGSADESSVREPQPGSIETVRGSVTADPSGSEGVETPANGQKTPGTDLDEVSTLHALVADLEALTGALRSDLDRYKRWAESRFWQLSERLELTWRKAKLTDRVHDLPDEVAKKYDGQLQELTAELGEWLDTLELGTGEVCHRIGLWEAMRGDAARASQWFRKAVQKGLGFEAWLALGDCLWQQGRREKAREAYAECARAEGMPEHVYQRIAEVAVDQHRYKEASSALERLLERPKPPVEVFTLASLVCGKLGDDARSVEVCQQGLELHGGSPELLASQIIPLARMGRLEEAEAIYDSVRELAPDLSEAQFAMGVALMNAGDAERAVSLLEHALQLDPDRAEVYFCLGVVHNQRGEFREALEDFQKAVDLKPGYAEAYYNMKDSFEGLRDFDSAMEMLQKATRLNPEYR